MSDALTNGRRIRTANVIDDCNREALRILIAFSLTSKRITRWLDQLAILRGYPNRIRVDNGQDSFDHSFIFMLRYEEYLALFLNSSFES